jgi:hypothetical protein
MYPACETGESVPYRNDNPIHMRKLRIPLLIAKLTYCVLLI